MIKLVNGVEVEMTAEEIAEREAIELSWLDAPLPVPYEISRPQMVMALRFLDKITEQEALDAMTIGAVPAAVQTVFDTMSPLNKFTATVRWAGASVVERNNPIVLALAASDEMSETELDDFFRFAATL